MEGREFYLLVNNYFDIGAAILLLLFALLAYNIKLFVFTNAGKIEKDDKGNFTIYLNNKHSNTRHIFTIAHELGHYFRHQKYFETNNSIEEPLYNTFQKDRTQYSEEESTREREANEFAAELLMPEITVKEKWNKLHLQIIFYGREFCSARGCDGTRCALCQWCYPNRKTPKQVKKP